MRRSITSKCKVEERFLFDECDAFTPWQVRNLPPLIDEAVLRAVAIKAASSAKGAGPAKLKQESRFTL